MHLCQFLAVFLACLAALGSSNVLPTTNSGKVIMCYFGSWSCYRWGNGFFDVESIDPFLCTHLVFGFAGLHKTEYTITSLDEYNDLEENWGKGAFKRFTNLKNINPNLKTLLAIGGWNEGSTAYSEMSRSAELRTKFIDSALEMVLKHNFDGLDLDWEYPGGRDDSPGFPEDRENHAMLLREMRAEFDKHNLMITAAVSAGFNTIDKAYDVKTMAQTLDFINLMSYDFHGWWENHAFTGHNSPLYALDEEMDESHPGYGLNTDFAVNHWLNKGAGKHQLLLGVGTYGRGFRLANPANNGFYAEAFGGIDPGFYTGTSGFWGYNEFCEKVQGQMSEWTFVRDEKVVGPYCFKGDQWLGYDDEKSFEVKANYIQEKGLAGAMVWSIDTDDFKGFCGRPNGLINTLADVLNGGKPTAGPTTSTSTTTPDPLAPTTTTLTPSTTTTSGEGGHTICGHESGIKPDPSDCHGYFMCQDLGEGQWDVKHFVCEPGLAFNPEILTCDWAENVPGCEAKKKASKSAIFVGKATFDCQDTGYFTERPCTAHFFECVYYNGILVSYEYYCAGGTVFDLRYNICNYPSNIPECQGVTETTRETTTVTGPTTTVTGPTPTSTTTVVTTTTEHHGPLPPNPICKKIGLNPNPYEGCSPFYYNCQLNSEGSDWIIDQLTCDSGLYFDSATLACTTQDAIVECGGATRPPTTTTKSTTTAATTTTTTTSEPSVCKYPGFNPDPSYPRDCSLYYSCKPAPGWEGHWLFVECHCAEGLAFDPALQVCTWPSSLDDCPSRSPLQFLRSLHHLRNNNNHNRNDDECYAKRVL